MALCPPVSPALAPERLNVIVPVPPTLGGNVGPPRVEVVVEDVLVDVELLVLVLSVVEVELEVLVLVVSVDEVELDVLVLVVSLDEVELEVLVLVLSLVEVELDVLVLVVVGGRTQVPSAGGLFTLNRRA